MNIVKSAAVLFTVLITSCSTDFSAIKNTPAELSEIGYFTSVNQYYSQHLVLKNTINKTDYYDIEGLEPYNKSKDAKAIKSDLNFKTSARNDISIDKIEISDDGSIVDSAGTGAIIPDYSGKKINLTLHGNFNFIESLLHKFFFINEPNLLHLSYIGENNLKTVVLINDTIVLNPISLSPEYMNVTINSRSLPDFYLEGLHNIKIISNNKTASSKIRIGKPIAPAESLVPQITKIELLKKDKNSSKVMALKLTGKNFMVNPQFYYTKIDGTFSPGYQSGVIKSGNGDIFETIINISHLNNFLKSQKHVIEFYTPFGMVYSEFEV